MSISLADLMSGFLEFVEAVAVKSTADAGSDATKIVDSALSIYSDDYFKSWWAYVTEGSAIGDIRQVEAFTKVSYTLDPFTDFSAAVADGDNYELHKHNPDSVKRAIQDALVSIHPKLYKKIVFENLGMDDLASNADSEQPDVVVNDESLFFVGQKLKIQDDDGSEDCTIKSITSATHKLTMEDNLANAYDTTMNAKVTAKSGNYFNLGATVGLAKITGVFLQADTTSQRKPYTNCWVVYSASGERQLYFPSSVLVDDQTWVIEALGRLEEVSDPADPVTLDSERVKLLYAEVAYQFYDRQANNVSAGDKKNLRALSLNHRDKVNTTYRHLWMPQPIERASIKTDEDYD